jgi:L-asparagine oxygenase
MAAAEKLVLSPRDQQFLVEACRRVGRYDVAAQIEDFVLEAQVQAAQLSEQLRRRLLAFRRFGHPSGGLLIGGVPIGALPATPDRADAMVGAKGTGAAALSILVACLGDQYGFRPELGGNVVQDILPVRGFERQQISVGSTVDLHAHTETAFSPHRPDYVALLCLRSDHERRAATTLSSVDAMLPLLDEPTIDVLRQPRFTTKVDPSFLIGGDLSEDVCIGPICVFTGPRHRPQLRADFAEMAGNDPVAQRALESLGDAAIEKRTIVRLDQGEMLVVDNNRAVHGRTPFLPRYDGRDRWLLRSLITRDLARSEDARPMDLRIVEPRYASEQTGA